MQKWFKAKCTNKNPKKECARQKQELLLKGFNMSSYSFVEPGFVTFTAQKMKFSIKDFFVNCAVL